MPHRAGCDRDGVACPRRAWRLEFTALECTPDLADGRVQDLPGKNGEVSEWLKEHAWKVCKRLNRASGVRIPLSPPDFPEAPLTAGLLMQASLYGGPVGPSRR